MKWSMSLDMISQLRAPASHCGELTEVDLVVIESHYSMPFCQQSIALILSEAKSDSRGELTLESEAGEVQAELGLASAF